MGQIFQKNLGKSAFQELKTRSFFLINAQLVHFQKDHSQLLDYSTRFSIVESSKRSRHSEFSKSDNKRVREMR